MARHLNLWCVVILASLTAAQPTKTKVSWKLESAMEQMRSECAQGKSDSDLACFKYKVFSAIDELFKNDSLEVSGHTSFSVSQTFAVYYLHHDLDLS
jgi:hypothetical protein